MQIRLGYVSQNKSIPLSPSHTITVKNFSKLETREEKIEKITKVAKENIENTKKILKWNIENNIKVYRISSNLIPLATWDGFSFPYQKLLKRELEDLGKLIKENDLRVSFHPDPFCVINSPSDKVFEATVRNLEYHDKLLQLMELDKKYKIVMHVGGVYGDKEYGKKQFIHRFRELPISVQQRVVLENDDKSYHTLDVLDLCGKLQIPMVMDIHHYHVNQMGEELESTLRKAFSTWEKERPKIHFSSPKSREEIRAHGEYIDVKEFKKFLVVAEKLQQDFDVMLEAKGKDLALLKLRNELAKK